MGVLGPENLCFMKEKEAFFLGDWSKLFEAGADVSMSVAPTTTSMQGKKLTSQELVEERGNSGCGFHYFKIEQNRSQRDRRFAKIEWRRLENI